MGFCDVVLGWDANDQLYDNVTYTGWHTGYPDANVRILPETCREIATEPGNLLFLCEFVDRAEELCPRGVLRRVLARAAEDGLRGQGRLRIRVLRLRRDRLLDPREGLQEPEADLARLLRLLGAAQLGPVRLVQGPARHVRDHGHGHRGPAHRDRRRRARGGAAGQRRRCAAADSAALFKLFTKVLAQKRDWLATFMAKWSKDWPGCGGHMHMSLWKGGKSAFYDEKAPHRMSTHHAPLRRRPAGADARAAGHGGGQREFLPPADPGLLGAHRVELGRREPHDVAARHSGLGQVDARRVPRRRRRRQPLSGAAPPRSASGLWGIENKVDPGEPIKGNSYDKKHPAKSQLPRTLMEAAGRLKASKAARELFGDAFVDHYSATREWEEREFRKAITEWELDRYMEII